MANNHGQSRSHLFPLPPPPPLGLSKSLSNFLNLTDNNHYSNQDPSQDDFQNHSEYSHQKYQQISLLSHRKITLDLESENHIPRLEPFGFILDSSSLPSISQANPSTSSSQLDNAQFDPWCKVSPKSRNHPILGNERLVGWDYLQSHTTNSQKAIGPADHPIDGMGDARSLFSDCYPTEVASQIWDSIILTHLSPKSKPIARSDFYSHFLRRSIGQSSQCTYSPIASLSPLRVVAHTGLVTQSINKLSERAYQDVSIIDKFVNVKQTVKACTFNHYSLESGLEILLNWIQIEISNSLESDIMSKSGLVSLSLMCQPLFDLLNALASLVQDCSDSDNNPNNIKPGRDEEVVYYHLDQHFQKASSSLVQAVFTWLLDRVCLKLIRGWSTWLGLEGTDRRKWIREKDELYEPLWRYCGIEKSKRSPDYHGQSESEYQDLDPHSADSISYFVLSVALRVLRNSGESNTLHPICLSCPNEQDGESRWVWTPDQLHSSNLAFDRQALNMRHLISAWRNRIEISIKSTCSSARPTFNSFKSQEFHWKSDQSMKEELVDLMMTINSGLKRTENRTNSGIRESGFDQPSPRRDGLVEQLEQRLSCCSGEVPSMLDAMEIPSLDLLSEISVFRPLLSRSKDINTSLVSFFLLELELIDHLDVLSRFMFCYDVAFTQRLSNALFDQSYEDFAGRVSSTSRETRKRRSTTEHQCVGVSKRLMRKGIWPPGGFDLSYALRTVVLDSVSRDQRPNSLKDSSAWHELEDRLSFAIEKTSTADTTYEPESIEGFEFLMLDFKPLEGLRKIFSVEALNQYKVVNKYLMKLIRLQSMMKENWKRIRPSRVTVLKHSDRRGKEDEGDQALGRKIYEHELNLLMSSSQRLLDGMMSFTWEIGIGRNWNRLMNQLQRLKGMIVERESWKPSELTDENLERDDQDGINQTECKKKVKEIPDEYSITIEGLIKSHQNCLKEICNSLFLRERQKQIQNIISQTIFQTIFNLSFHLSNPIDDNDHHQNQNQNQIELIQNLKQKQFIGIKRLIKSFESLNQRAVDQQQFNRSQHQSLIGLGFSNLNDHHQNFEVGFLKELIIRLDWNEFFF